MAKKKDTTKLLFLAGIAAAAFYFFRPKTASAADGLPPLPPDDDGEPPAPSPEPPGSPRRDAPPMGQSVQSAINAGKIAVNQLTGQMNAGLIGVQGWDEVGPPPHATPEEAAEVQDAFGVPDGRTPASWIADAAYFGLWPSVDEDDLSVPSAAQRGSGWSPYITVWKALWEQAKAELTPGLNI